MVVLLLMNNSSFKSAALWIIKIGFFIVPFIPLYVSRVLFFPVYYRKGVCFSGFWLRSLLATWVFLAIFIKNTGLKICTVDCIEHIHINSNFSYDFWS